VHAISLSVHLPYVAGAWPLVECTLAIRGWCMHGLHLRYCVKPVALGVACKKLHCLLGEDSTFNSLVHSALLRIWRVSHRNSWWPFGTSPCRYCTLFYCCGEYTLYAFVHSSCHKEYTTDVRDWYILLQFFFATIQIELMSVNRVLDLESIHNSLLMFCRYNSIINVI